MSCLWPIRLQIVKQPQIFPRFTLGAKHLFTPQLISAAWQPHSKAKGEPFILLTPFCSSDCRACQNAIINLFKLKLSISQQRVNSLDWKQNVETVPCGERLEMLIGCNEGSNVTIPESSLAVWFCPHSACYSKYAKPEVSLPRPYYYFMTNKTMLFGVKSVD